MGKQWVCLVCAFLVFGPALAAQAAVGPVGWWMFDEKTGTTAADSSPNKNNGTVNGGATWVVGQIGGAVQCDGTNDFVSLPIGGLISKLTNSTFAIWANYSQQGGAWQRILDFGTGETVNMFLTPAIGGSNTGNLRFAITAGGSGAESQLTAQNRLATGWHHLAVVINGDARTMQLYLDGNVVASGATNTLPSGLGNTTQNWLGRSEYGADAYYQGSLDDFRIYDRTLTQEEVQKVMLGGGFGTAGAPLPEDKATDVLRDVSLGWTPADGAKTHDVYLGTSFADVNNASRATPLNVLVSKGQDPNSYAPPAVFTLGQTYYWRVDEVNAAPDFTVFRGDVWQFTVEPYSYPIPVTAITPIASSARLD